MGKIKIKFNNTRTCLILLVIGIFFLSIYVPIPYIALQSGPTYNLLGKTKEQGIKDSNNRDIIEVDKKANFIDTGHLDMTTVGLVDNISVFEGLKMWWSGKYALLPREIYYPPEVSTQEINEANDKQFFISEDNALLAAANYLQVPLRIRVSDGNLAKFGLKENDRISDYPEKLITINEKGNIQLNCIKNSYRELAVYDQALKSEKFIKIVCNDFSAVHPIKSFAIEPQFSKKVKLNLQGVGGPSAGLMLTLALIEKISSLKLANGRYIAGTGTINPAGVVGPIGGIKYKIAAAVAKGATVFLVPAANYAEALATNTSGKINLIKVNNLSEAVKFLLN